MTKLRLFVYLLSAAMTFIGGAAAQNWHTSSLSESVSISEGGAAISSPQMNCSPKQENICSYPSNDAAFKAFETQIVSARTEERKATTLLGEAKLEIVALQHQIEALKVSLATKQDLDGSEESKVKPKDLDLDRLEKEIQRERFSRAALEVELDALKTNLRDSEQEYNACTTKISELELSLESFDSRILNCSKEVDLGMAKVAELGDQLTECINLAEDEQTARNECSIQPGTGTGVKGQRWIEKLGGNRIWRGAVSQPSSSTPYGLVLKIEEDLLKADYPELSCGGVWEYLYDIESNRWMFKENITYDLRPRCIDGGDVVLEMQNSGVLRFEWSRPGRESVDAWADLLPLTDQ